MTKRDNYSIVKLRFYTRASFSLLVILICMYKIATAADNDGQRPVYWSTLTSTSALWMPSKDKAEDDEDNKQP